MGLLWSLGKAIVGKARDHEADPNCNMCLGSGTYVDGKTVKTCQCVWNRALAKRHAAWAAQAARAARAEPFVPLAVQLYADPESPAQRADRERRHEQWQETGQQTGAATLCCKALICKCKQNLRMIDGVETALPGVMPLGWEDNEVLRGVEEARLRLEAGESKTYSLRERAKQQHEARLDTARADRPPTSRPEPDDSGMEFPSMGEPPPQR